MTMRMRCIIIVVVVGMRVRKGRQGQSRQGRDGRRGRGAVHTRQDELLLLGAARSSTWVGLMIGAFVLVGVSRF